MSEFELVDLKPGAADFQADVEEGLSAAQKHLSPKYFYDDRGSGLFDEICQLEEYYPTRTEMKILDDHANEIESRLERPSSIIEFGSGSSNKIQRLLQNSSKIRRYVPIDISKDHLHRSALRLRRDFPALNITAVCADYTNPGSLSRIRLKEDNNKYIFFPGSTLGNLDPEDALELLKNAKNLVGPEGQVILGIDLVKDEETLVAAYNDRKGVTAAFNQNLLVRINRELHGEFQVENFEHLAFFNKEKSRIEMHLRARVEHDVKVGSRYFHFCKGETIHTESSHKYDLGAFEEFTQQIGLSQKLCLTDPGQNFAVVMLG